MKLVQRVREVTQVTAAVYGATADIEISAGGPPLICDPATTDDFVKYMRELDLPGAMEYPNISASASEDFAFVAERVPSAFIFCPAAIWTSAEIIPRTIRRCSSTRKSFREALPIWPSAHSAGLKSIIDPAYLRK